MHKNTYNLALARHLEFNFSQRLSGAIWNMVNDASANMLAFEIRDEMKRQVSFAWLKLATGEMMHTGFKAVEPWWVSLAGMESGVVLLQTFTDVQNPDEKSLTAIDAHSAKVKWKVERFSMQETRNGKVYGFFIDEHIQSVTIDVVDGVIRPVEDDTDQHRPSNDCLIPFLYQEESAFFSTVKKFILRYLQQDARAGAEYLEYQGLTFVSYYVDEGTLANYLIVIDETGGQLLSEKIDTAVKGTGVSTFFILSGCLFFVKNKVELISYRIV